MFASDCEEILRWLFLELYIVWMFTAALLFAVSIRGRRVPISPFIDSMTFQS